MAEFKDEEAPKTAAAAKAAKKPEAKPGKLGVAVTELTAEQKKTLKVTARRGGGGRRRRGARRGHRARAT